MSATPMNSCSRPSTADRRSAPALLRPRDFDDFEDFDDFDDVAVFAPGPERAAPLRDADVLVLVPDRVDAELRAPSPRVAIDDQRTKGA